MVIIFSRTNDGSTSDVLKWIKLLGGEVLRINADSPSVVFKKIDLLRKEIIFEAQEYGEINLLTANSVWFRRGGVGFRCFDLHLDKDDLSTVFPERGLENFILNHISAEVDTIIQYIHYALETHCKSLGSYFNASLNKLYVLDLARSLGLLVPQTFISSNKKHLTEFISETSGAITKALSDGIYLSGETQAYYTYTEKVDRKFITNLNHNICHSLIQEKIDKEFELRSFYLDGQFYSMAIFSQRNSRTDVDFRKYDQTTPNRVVPYKLPLHVCEKLTSLMRALKLNTGSIDLVVDKNGNFIFLEINPVGQFGMVSQPCNYYIEKKVAEYLLV